MNKEKWVYSTLVISSVVLYIAGWRMGYSQPREFIKASEVKTAEVRSGTFTQKVNGYGELQSVNQRLITANDPATVDELLLKPGAKVSANTIILRLKNPQLQQKLQAAKTALQKTITDRSKQDLQQQRELLEQESTLADVKAESELADLQVEAETTLAKSGVVSKMEFKRSQVKAKQLKNRIILLKTQLEKLADVHTQQLTLMDDAIAQARSDFATVKLQLDNLEVKAGLDGVLQRLPVKLGQAVQPGTELALVGSLNPLMAQIKVPQLQVSLLRVGAKADIDSRSGIVQGMVSRIDPVVEDGAVTVDIELPQVSDNIKPMQVIDAVIYGQGKQNVLYIEKPSGAHSGSKLQVFKLIENQLAQKVEVSFGNISENLIEVKSGLKVGEKVVISQHKLNDNTQTLHLTE